MNDGIVVNGKCDIKLPKVYAMVYVSNICNDIVVSSLCDEIFVAFF